MCCLWGLIDYQGRLSGRQKSRLLTVLAAESEARGTDATGVAYNANGKLNVYKRPVAPRKFHPIIPKGAQVLMGHTRMTTQGSEKKNHNNHPFVGKVEEGNFALAHNGVLHNDHSLKLTHNLPTTKIETDSYVAVQLIEKKKTLHPDSLKFMAEQVEGSFVFTVLDEENTLTFIKGDNPLALFHYPRLGLYLYASTEAILKLAVRRTWLVYEEMEEVEVDSGEILQIDRFGKRSSTHFKMPDPWEAWGSRYSWFYPQPKQVKDAHVEELKALAYSFGYCPDDVDVLLKEGFTADEIEDYFYSRADGEAYAGYYSW